MQDRRRPPKQYAGFIFRPRELRDGGSRLCIPIQRFVGRCRAQCHQKVNNEFSKIDRWKWRPSCVAVIGSWVCCALSWWTIAGVASTNSGKTLSGEPETYFEPPSYGHPGGGGYDCSHVIRAPSRRHRIPLSRVHDSSPRPRLGPGHLHLIYGLTFCFLQGRGICRRTRRVSTTGKMPEVPFSSDTYPILSLSPRFRDFSPTRLVSWNCPRAAELTSASIHRIHPIWWAEVRACRG